MIFLNPAILVGLLAASIPVLIHLFNLRKLKKIEFSTLSFLKELQKNKIRKIKLKQLMLLALRVLIILFLVLAFARPTLEGLAIGGTTSAAKTSAVFILDDSFSMSTVDNNGSYFNQAKQTVISILANMQEGDEAALILSSERNREVLNFSNDLSGMIDRIGNISVSYGSGIIEDAFVLAAQLLSESKNFNKEIFVVSDLQKSTFSRSEETPVINNLTDDKVRMYFVRFNGNDVDNLAITDFKLATQIFEKGKPVSFTVKINNFSKRTVENNVASLFCNNERVAQQSFTLAAGEAVQLKFEAPITASGFIEAFVEIEDDAIIRDNKRFISFFIPEEIPVLILFDKESDTRFVELALNVPGSYTSLSPDKKNVNQIASINLNKYKAIVLCGQPTEQNAQKLKTFINNGGGVLFYPGSESSLPEFSSVLMHFGLKVPTASAGKINETGNIVHFDKIEFGHPIFENMFTNEQKRKINSPDIYYYFKITGSEKSLPLITLEDNSAFLTESIFGNGKIFVLSTSPVMSWTNFPLKGFFVPLINRSVNYLASAGNGDETMLVGDFVQLNERLLNAPQLRVVNPDKTEEIINRKGGNEQLPSLFKGTYWPGNYKVFQDDIVDMFSINTDPIESDIQYLSENEIRTFVEKTKFAGRTFYINIADDPVKAVVQSRFGSELWRYFILIALFLAIIEMLVARSRKKDLLQMSNIK